MPNTHWELHRMSMKAMEQAQKYAHSGVRKDKHRLRAMLSYMSKLTERG